MPPNDIRLIISDVDGVLTDGSITYGSDGAEVKSFHVRDGLGIKLWQRMGFEFAILTARKSAIVQRRGEELGIDIIKQGFADKLPAAMEIWQETGITPEQTCYIGDDFPDMAVMKRVAFPATVADAAPEVVGIAKWCTQSSGGKGAVRELVRHLLIQKGLWSQCVPE